MADVGQGVVNGQDTLLPGGDSSEEVHMRKYTCLLQRSPVELSLCYLLQDLALCLLGLLPFLISLPLLVCFGIFPNKLLQYESSSQSLFLGTPPKTGGPSQLSCLGCGSQTTHLNKMNTASRAGNEMAFLFIEYAAQITHSESRHSFSQLLGALAAHTHLYQLPLAKGQPSWHGWPMWEFRSRPLCFHLEQL